jgi:endonuclease-3 related protein
LSRKDPLDVYKRLGAVYDFEAWHWQPDTPALDICVGSVLVQHTSWTNVEKALANLRAANVMSLEALAALPDDELATLVRPAGTPLAKSRRLKALAALVLAKGGFDGLFALSTSELRALLLSTPGIGPETADAILLYAAGRPVALHDAYTARLFRRLGLGPPRDRYDAWQAWQDALIPPDTLLRQRFHAAIVLHAKERCRVRPRCDSCPLLGVCQSADNSRST